MYDGDDMKYKMEILFFLVYAFGALSTTQTIPFLKEQGFNEIQQGFILASIALFTILLQLIFGILSDKTGKMKCFFLVVFLSSSAVTVWLYTQEINSFWLLFLLIGWIGGAGRCNQSMIDTWALEKSDEKHDFEKDKAIGSLGWAAGAWIGAVLVSALNWKVLSFFCLICSISAIGIAFMISDGHRKSSMEWSQLRELVLNRKYVLLVGLMTILFAMGCADIYLVVDKMIALGGTSFHIGLKWGLQSLAEAPVFLISDKLLKRFKLVNLLIFSTLMFGVRFLIYGFVQRVWILVACALLQSVTFPIAIYCTKIGIDQCIDEKIKSTGQLAGASMYMGISLLIMPVLTSFLTKIFSHDAALFCVAFMVIPAFVLIHMYKKSIF